MHNRDRNVDYECLSIYHWTVWLIKINNFNIIDTICKVVCIFFHESDQSPSLIFEVTSEQRTFVPSGSDLIGMLSNRRLTLFSYHISQIRLLFRFVSEDLLDFTNVIWCGRFLWETNFKMWKYRYDLMKYGKIFIICSLVSFLLHRLILHLYFSSGIWCQLSSSSATWAVIVSSVLISMIHTFSLACVGGWWLDGESSIVSVT